MDGLLKMTEKEDKALLSSRRESYFSISLQGYQADIEYTYKNMKVIIAFSSTEK